MPRQEPSPKYRLPRIAAYLMGAFVVPLAMEAMYLAAYEVSPAVARSGPSDGYVWLSVWVPGTLLNALLALVSIRQRRLALFLPRLLTLAVFTVLGMILYFFLLFAMAGSGGLKAGG